MTESKSKGQQKDTPEWREQILIRLLEFYDTAEEALKWFNSPQPLLDKYTPKELAERGETEKVEQMLRQLEDGVHI